MLNPKSQTGTLRKKIEILLMLYKNLNKFFELVNVIE